MISKHRMAVLKKSPNEALEKLIRATTLVDNGTRDELLKLAVDRNHVAHGRPPYVLAHDAGYTIERYIAAARKVLSAYLASIPGGTWPEVMTLQVARSRK